MNTGKNIRIKYIKSINNKEETEEKRLCFNLFFGNPGLFLAVPLAVMKTAAIAVKYVEVMNGHLREMRRITRLLRR